LAFLTLQNFLANLKAQKLGIKNKHFCALDKKEARGRCLKIISSYHILERIFITAHTRAAVTFSHIASLQVDL
jgi:hypothetical protein